MIEILDITDYASMSSPDKIGIIVIANKINEIIEKINLVEKVCAQLIKERELK